METRNLDSRLRLLRQSEMKGKVVLVRVDHNVVKKGRIDDPYRIDATFQTLYAIAEKGGRPVLMTHIGRPKDKKTGKITCKEGESVTSIVQYLEQKLPVRVHIASFPADPDAGIRHIDESIAATVRDLREGKIGMIYLPNTRWFQGEESKGPERAQFAKELAGLADVFVNDAFGSWQAHASTFDVAGLMPPCAGILLEKEILNLHRVLNPERPFVCVIAGAKYDTKIGPLKALHEKADYLILGGLLYNTYLAAKYGVQIAGVSDEDRSLAAALVEADKGIDKIVELPYLLESDSTEARVEGQWRTVSINEFAPGKGFRFFLDVDPKSIAENKVREVIGSARTIFVNAVMGLMPHFPEGSRALYGLIASNKSAAKLFGGGDTLQELRNLCPGVYLSGLDDPKTYYFTGGGSVLEAIQQGSPYLLKPVAALMNPA